MPLFPIFFLLLQPILNIYIKKQEDYEDKNHFITALCRYGLRL